jgi:hypothetical protein
VAESADATDLKSVGQFTHTGSSPVSGTTSEQASYRLLRLFLKSERAHLFGCSPSQSNPFCWGLGAKPVPFCLGAFGITQTDIIRTGLLWAGTAVRMIFFSAEKSLFGKAHPPVLKKRI